MNARQRRKEWRLGCRLMEARTPVKVRTWWADTGFQVCRIVSVCATGVVRVVPFYKVATPSRTRNVRVSSVRVLRGLP